MANTSGSSPAVRRGEIWWVDFDPTQGAELRKRRPAVVITADGLNRARRTVVVVPLSSGPQPHPPIVVATPSAGQRSVAVCDQLRAVDKRRLVRNEGRLSGADLISIEEGIRRILAL
ncbi:MAG: type II toxin-antitoxin system PemK/MazF family toxin [Alphaproteobacteria bacterium]|nr:type II toxin-antitoxin system PemK/MazF family toxin [Alphaproteobacteria bacterium]MBV9587312.1 type II toxin-antitoxin system PemK/MazF family toxin [Alphaproteobacteria bacterium]